jgi:hypothetical protein
MSENSVAIDAGTIADRARSLWRDASSRSASVGVELYAKVAIRSRVTRDNVGTGVTVDRTRETGLAVRALSAGRDHAGFAATSGLTGDSVRWAVDTASKFEARASALTPDPSEIIQSERWDLDVAAAPPDEATLTNHFMAQPHLEWVEAGTTVEVLIGAEGWLAVRRRHRVWALRAGPRTGLIAQRGFEDWEQHLDEGDGDDLFVSASKPAGLGVVVFRPGAATSVVGALVDAFHGPSSIRPIRLGDGWEISDEPVRADGLAGGSFDDAGFSTEPLVLAARGAWLGRLSGPGSFRRGSFREPPTEAASNLFMASGRDRTIPPDAVVAERCRILRLSNDVWVLGIDVAGTVEPNGLARRWLRIDPRALLAACSTRLGRTRVTPTGPMVPALVFEGILSE